MKNHAEVAEAVFGPARVQPQMKKLGYGEKLFFFLFTSKWVSNSKLKQIIDGTINKTYFVKIIYFKIDSKRM